MSRCRIYIKHAKITRVMAIDHFLYLEAKKLVKREVTSLTLIPSKSLKNFPLLSSKDHIPLTSASKVSLSRKAYGPTRSQEVPNRDEVSNNKISKVNSLLELIVSISDNSDILLDRIRKTIFSYTLITVKLTQTIAKSIKW